MELDHWAESITKRVYLEWKKNYSFWESGFKIFYGPLRTNPDVMIISYNPGGSKYYFDLEDHNRYKKGDFSPPETNTYLLRDNMMARRMRDFFAGHIKQLEESVTLPVLFFRSKNKRHLVDSFPKETRLVLEQFCTEIVKEIISTIKPKRILVVGFETLGMLQDYIFEDIEFVETRLVDYARKERLYLKATWKNTPIFAIRHPTGSRIRRQDWCLIKEKFWT